MDPQWVSLLEKALPAIGTIVGAVVGGLIAGVIGFLNARSTEAAQRRLAADAARRVRREQRVAGLLAYVNSRLGLIMELRAAANRGQLDKLPNLVERISTESAWHDYSWSPTSDALANLVAILTSAEVQITNVASLIARASPDSGYSPDKLVNVIDEELDSVLISVRAINEAADRYIDGEV